MAHDMSPATFADPPPKEALRPSEWARGERSTLLVVDDEEGVRESLRVIFQDSYDVKLAPDGRRAVEFAQNERIDVALVDIRMGGMSGIEVLERLKFIDPSIEVVMMTAFETTETMRQALRLRACDYINKPFDISTMRAAVGSAMRRRSLEGEVLNNSEQLQKLLKELQDQRMQEQITRTRGEIYASIIHDINGPLTVISGFIQLLNQRIGGAAKLDEEDLQFVKERLKTITRQVTNCIEISRRYLSFLRERPGETPHVSVNELLVDLGQLLRVHPSLQGNDFSIGSLPHDIAVRMHGTDLLQVLLNLSVNALQATPRPHKVKVQPAVLDQPLKPGELKDTSQVRVLNMEHFENVPPILAIAITDNGPGIPPEALPRIFQPFFTTKAGRNGTGLGLNIVQRLVREARGAIQVQSEPGVGTSVCVYVPASRE